MEWELAKKVGTAFEYDGKKFYDLSFGPGKRRMVVAGVGVLDKRYGFSWLYTPVEGKTPFTRDNAAAVLINQFRFSLIDYRSFLLSQGKLTNSGEEIGFKQNDRILESTTNRACSDREYAVAA